MLKERIRYGLMVGLVMATMYSAWSLLLYFVARRPPSGGSTVAIHVAILAYYSAGTIGGAVIGAMLPLRDSWPGIVLLGVVTALILFFCVEIATSGPFWLWNGEVWREMAMLAVLCGVPGAIVIKLQSRRE